MQPQPGLAQFATNLNIPPLTNGNIRQAYIYILTNGRTAQGDAIEQNTINALQNWIAAQNDNETLIVNNVVIAQDIWNGLSENAIALAQLLNIAPPAQELHALDLATLNGISAFDSRKFAQQFNLGVNDLVGFQQQGLLNDISAFDSCKFAQQFNLTLPLAYYNKTPRF